MEASQNISIASVCSDSNELISTNTSRVVKIYPISTELSTIENEIRCTEENCGGIFNSHSNLNLHLQKTHNKNVLHLDTSIKQFYCPETECIYHEGQHFKTRKLLKQHYLKVHSPKIFKCEKCGEGFGSMIYKNLHIDYCGVVFKCSDCPVRYSRYETLVTHARRKNHTIKNKMDFKTDLMNEPTISRIKRNKIKYILPKPLPSTSFIIISGNPVIKSDQSIQTENIPYQQRHQPSEIRHDSLLQKKYTKETQTYAKNKRSTVETQTISESSTKKSVASATEGLNYSKYQSPTETSDISAGGMTSNTNFNMNTDFEINKQKLLKDEIVDSSCDILYSQTTSHAENNAHIATSDIIETNLENLDIFNCNSETQTDSIFDDDLFNYCDYYSNMYTQTSEDVFFNSLELNHIETQTVDEMLRSVESQTIVSQTKKPNVNGRDISHMETQTDLDFEQLLESVDV